MSATPDWILVVTGLAAGVIGSVITTYGAQTRERREIRVHARDDLQTVENLATDPNTTKEEMAAALNKLEASAMIAGLPETLTAVYRGARWKYWEQFREKPSHFALIAQPTTDNDVEWTTTASVAWQAAQLLAAATWHPRRGALYRLYRARRLTRLLRAGVRGSGVVSVDVRRILKDRERETIKEAKKLRKVGRAL